MIGIRSTLASILGSTELERTIRSVAEEVVAARSFAAPADIQSLREQIAELRQQSNGGSDPEEVESLRRRLDMAMGALQAATAQIADLRRALEEARADARQALARAGSALATAESLADAVAELEQREAPPAAPADGRSVNVNTASLDELRALQGVGPSLAARIIEAREEARFNGPADLARVKGLGQATVARLASILSY